MAYISSEQVKEIRNQIKKEFGPKGYKVSVTKKDYSSVNVSITSSPYVVYFENHRDGYMQVNHYSLDRNEVLPEGMVKDLQRIVEIAMTGNFDESDPMTDYFHVGWYLNLSVGKWDKPYVVNEKVLDEMIEKQSEEIKEAQVEESKTSEPAKVVVSKYSEKAIAVQGETYPIKDQLKELGGKFNKFLKGGPGWIFPMDRLPDLKRNFA